MITFIRKQFKGPTYKIMLWVFLFCVALGGALTSLFMRQSHEGQWLARINGQEIGYKEYVQEVTEKQNAIHRMRSQYGEYADQLFAYMGMSSDPKKQALDSLIQEELLCQAADKADIYLHSDYIADKFPVGDQNVMRMQLKRSGISVADFERKFERDLASGMMMDLAVAASYVPDFAVKQQYIAQKLNKKLSLLSFELDDFLKKEKKETLSDGDIKKFFDEQNIQFNRYAIPEKRSGVVWKIPAQSYGLAISDEQIESFYNKNKGVMFVGTPAQVQVRHILFKVEDLQNKSTVEKRAQEVRSELIKNPTQFAEIAQQNSDDTITKNKGGLMPPFAKGEKEPSLERAAFLLKEPGDISELIETKDGIELIQLVEKKAKKFKELSAVKDEIKERLTKNIFGDTFVRDIKQAQAAGGDEVEMIARFAGKKGGKKTVIKDVTQKDAQEGDAQAIKALFKIAKKDGFNYYLENGTAFIVQLSAINASRIPQLDEVQEMVVNDLYKRNASQALKQAFQDAQNKAKTVPLEQLQDEFNTSLESTAWVKPNAEKLPTILSSKDISARILTLLDSPGMIIEHRSNGNAYLIRLDEIAPFEQEAFSQDKKELESALETDYSRLLTEGFVASLYRNATIETNDVILGIQE